MTYIRAPGFSWGRETRTLHKNGEVCGTLIFLVGKLAGRSIYLAVFSISGRATSCGPEFIVARVFRRGGFLSHEEKPRL
jgi:hypothetical protein